jgi:hypothetical protein
MAARTKPCTTDSFRLGPNTKIQNRTSSLPNQENQGGLHATNDRSRSSGFALAALFCSGFGKNSPGAIRLYRHIELWLWHGGFIAGKERSGDLLL